MKNIKPSELITLALHDLEVVESMPDKYTICMSAWHNAYNGKCEVCLAGAVMAISLKTPMSESVSPSELSLEQFKLLTALNSFRNGNVAHGLITMDIVYFSPKKYWDVPKYELNPVGFKREMQKMVTYLERNGL